MKNSLLTTILPYRVYLQEMQRSGMRRWYKDWTSIPGLLTCPFNIEQYLRRLCSYSEKKSYRKIHNLCKKVQNRISEYII